MRFTRSHPRSGFSLLEMAIVAALMAIGAAVVAPKWSQAVDRAKVRSAVVAIEHDLAALRGWSVRHGVELQVSIDPGTSKLSVSPPVPELFGDASGTLNYANKFPGIAIADANFDNNQAYRINVFGDLLADTSSAPLSTGLVTISGPSSTQTIDLLAGIDSGSANTSSFSPVAQSASSSAAASPLGAAGETLETAASEVGDTVDSIAGQTSSSTQSETEPSSGSKLGNFLKSLFK